MAPQKGLVSKTGVSVAPQKELMSSKKKQKKKTSVSLGMVGDVNGYDDDMYLSWLCGDLIIDMMGVTLSVSWPEITS